MSSDQAYADVYDLMETTELLFSEMVKEITGSYKVEYHPDGPEGKTMEIDFSRPWKRLDMITTLELERLNVKFPPGDDLHSRHGDQPVLAKGSQGQQPGLLSSFDQRPYARQACW